MRARGIFQTKMKSETKMKECEECDGEGQIYHDTSSQCSRPVSDCCGGCGYDVQCETCCGEGEVECEDLEDED